MLFRSTREYALSRGELFLILLRGYIRKPILWLALVLSVLMVITPGVKGGILFFLIFLAAVLAIVSSQVFLKGSAPIFSRRSCEIDDDHVSIFPADSSSARIRIDSLIKVFRSAQCYLLYISRNQFVYLPLSAFSSDSDVQAFESMLKGKKLLK